MNLANEVIAHILKCNDLRVIADKLDNLDLPHMVFQLGTPSLVLWGRKTLEEARRDARIVGDALGTHEWRMRAPFNVGNAILVDHDFVHAPVIVRCSFPIDAFPMDEVSPGCRLEKKERVEAVYSVVCHVKEDS